MVTCLDCGTSITGPDGEGMTSNEVVILELVRPVASAMMTTPGRTFLRQYRTQCRPEETHILLNGDHSRNAGIHILPMRIWSRRHGVGQRLMNIAITCRTHKLPVYAPDLKGVCGATPAPGALAYIDGVRARSCHPKYRIAHHGRWPISGIAHALRILRTHVWHHGSSPPFPGRTPPDRFARTTPCAAKIHRHQVGIVPQFVPWLFG